MRTILGFLLLLVCHWHSVHSAGVIKDLSSHAVVFGKVKDLMLTIRWDNKMEAEAMLNDEQKENCIFPGKFVQDSDSEVLVTGCEDEDELSVQFQSEKYGSQVFAVTKNGSLMDEHSQENGVEDDFEDEDELLSQDLDLLFELAEPNYPSRVELSLNIYLDPYLADFYRHVRKRPKRVANQIVAQANLLMNHSSLMTKVGLVLAGFHDSTKHLGMKTSRMANSEYNEVLPTLLKEPFRSVGGDPVVHVYLTYPDGVLNGKGKIASLCNITEKPRILINGKGLTSATAVTLSHELGHVLGMYHDFYKRDERSSSTCAEKGEGGFILNYATKNAPSRSIWSKCSNDDFKTYFKKVYFLDGSFCLGGDAEKTRVVVTIPMMVLVLLGLTVGGVYVYFKKYFHLPLSP